MENNVFKKSKTNCIRKKLHSETYAKIIDGLLPRQALERDLQHEFDVTTECAPELEVHVPIITEAKNNIYKGKLFMEDAGKNLWRVPAKDLSINQIVKILNDVARQALSAFKKGFFMPDIKPENIVYDAAKQKATIIDHGCTVRQGDELLGYSLAYLPKGVNYFEPNNNKHEINKIMVYSIGVSIADWMLGDRFFSYDNPYEFNSQAVAELNIDEDFKQLLLGMIEEES